MLKNSLFRSQPPVDTKGEKYLEIEYKYQVSIPFRTFQRGIGREPDVVGASTDFFYTKPDSERGEFYRARLFKPYDVELTYKKKFTNWNITRKEINIPLESSTFGEINAFVRTFANYKGELTKDYNIWLGWFGTVLSFYTIRIDGSTFVEIEAETEHQLEAAEKELTRLFGITKEDRIKQSLFELYFDDAQ